jgi:uncharacterized protein (DUF2147 family)
MKTLVVAAIVAGLVLPAAAAPAKPPQAEKVPPPQAEKVPAPPGLTGLWRVADGTATIRVKPCGRALCGYVASAPAPTTGAASAVGQKILIDLILDGPLWRGVIFNVDDGKAYRGEITVDGDRLKVKGCLPTGFCGGEVWRREEEPAAPRKTRTR